MGPGTRPSRGLHGGGGLSATNRIKWSVVSNAADKSRTSPTVLLSIQSDNVIL